MALLGYKSEFAILVELSIKRQTIRAPRKYPVKAGERLYHYTGLRTKACRKLLESTCMSVADIRIDADGAVFIDGDQLNSKVLLDIFAWQDGFRATPGKSEHDNFIDFFKTVHGLPFAGQLIKW